MSPASIPGLVHTSSDFLGAEYNTHQPGHCERIKDPCKSPWSQICHVIIRLTMWVRIIWVAVCIQGEVELGVVQAQRPAAKALCPQLGCDPMQRQHIVLHLQALTLSCKLPSCCPYSASLSS